MWCCISLQLFLHYNTTYTYKNISPCNNSRKFCRYILFTLYQYLLMSHPFIVKASRSGHLPECVSTSVHACFTEVSRQTMLRCSWFSICCTLLVDFWPSLFASHSSFSPSPIALYYSLIICRILFSWTVLFYLCVRLFWGSPIVALYIPPHNHHSLFCSVNLLLSPSHHAFVAFYLPVTLFWRTCPL